MPDICIFYSEPDENIVEALSLILKDFGWSVWWDKDIKNGRWAPEIEKSIKNARCVMPIWNSRAISNKSITFLEADKSREQDKPMITLISEKLTLPIPFNSEHITANVGEWDYSESAYCISDIIESIESVLGIAPKKWNGERPSMINLLGKKVKLPCFVKSLSSHETQLDPEAGLIALSLFPEVDALLVSAYDMYLEDDDNIKEIEKERYEYKKERHKDMCEKLKTLYNRGAFILLDSGNYEKSRKKDDAWNENKFKWVLDNISYTHAFCFDNLFPEANPVKNAEQVIESLQGNHEEKMIPILHAPMDKNGDRNHFQLPDIFFEFAFRKKSPFIAVPERELGEGICQKAKTVIKIREKLNTLDHYQPIHILGTGNPLSILILAAAGADLFDGLEWCRTVADRTTGFLFHHQQLDFFKSQTIINHRYLIVKDFLESKDVRLPLKMAFHNLEFFLIWMEELQFNINKKNIQKMITEKAMFNSNEFLAEIKVLMPGLFQ